MAEIRHATVADLPEAIALGRQMHAEAPALRHAPYNAAKVGHVLELCIERGLFLVHLNDEGAIDGGLAGLVMPRWYSSAEYFTDVALFVSPDRRGGVVAYRLITEAAKWCRDRGLSPEDVSIGVTSGVNQEQTARLLERIGFACIGGNFQLRSYANV